MARVDLNTLVKLLTRNNGRNDAGEYLKDWAPIGEAWAQVKPLRGQVLLAGQREESRADFMVTLYFRTDLIPNESRVEWDDRQFTVIHSAESEHGEPRQYTQLLVKEERGT